MYETPNQSLSECDLGLCPNDPLANTSLSRHSSDMHLPSIPARLKKKKLIKSRSTEDGMPKAHQPEFMSQVFLVDDVKVSDRVFFCQVDIDILYAEQYAKLIDKMASNINDE